MRRPPVCKYDPGCFRKNADHFKKYLHPSLEVARAPSPKRAFSPVSKHRTTPESPQVHKHQAVKSADLSPPRNRASPSLSPQSRKRVRSPSNSRGSALRFEIPPPRLSPLGGSPNDVYESLFPLEDMVAVLEAAKEVCAFPGLRLVGPFEVLQGFTFPSDKARWSHWRFRYDPPEVQTFAVSLDASNSGIPKFHLAFHRDDPKQLPSMIVRAEGNDPFFSIEGSMIGRVLADMMPAGSEAQAALEKRFPKPSDKYSVARQRARTSLGKTLSNLGLLVPYDKKADLGYREPLYSVQKLKGLLQAVNNCTITPKQQDDLDEQYRFADIANDECDFGLSLEIGLDLFASVVKNNAVFTNCLRILNTAYMLLGRDLYQHILMLHAKLLADGGPPLEFALLPPEARDSPQVDLCQ